jgi:hypothetical protein
MREPKAASCRFAELGGVGARRAHQPSPCIISTFPPAGPPPTKCATAGGVLCQCPDQPAISPCPVPCHPDASAPVATATVSTGPFAVYPSAGSPVVSSSCHHVWREDAPPLAADMVMQLACEPH